MRNSLRSLRFLPSPASLAVIVSLMVVASAEAALPNAMDGGERLGEVRLFHPAATAAEVIFLFSDRAGWNDATNRAATALAAEGGEVVGVDLSKYLAALNASDDDCLFVMSEIEGLSQRVQRLIGFSRYRPPVLAGIGAGGTFVYAA